MSETIAACERCGRSEQRRVCEVSMYSAGATAGSRRCSRNRSIGTRRIMYVSYLRTETDMRAGGQTPIDKCLAYSAGVTARVFRIWSRSADAGRHVIPHPSTPTVRRANSLSQALIRQRL
jgi:hypothetical protein